MTIGWENPEILVRQIAILGAQKNTSSTVAFFSTNKDAISFIKHGNFDIMPHL